MASVVKRQRYVNRQSNYADSYTIAYHREADGTFTIHAEDRPRDPVRVYEQAHVDLDGTKVCVAKGREPLSLERAEAVAHAWMTGYSVYVRTGRFPKGTVRVDV